MSIFLEKREKEKPLRLFFIKCNLTFIFIYLPDDKKANEVMRPSEIFNKIIDEM